MNSMIIAIVSIVLVLILSGVGVFYGGEVYKNKQVEGAVAKYKNEASQINAAITVFESEGNDSSQAISMNDLVEGGYLKSIPNGWVMTSIANKITVATKVQSGNDSMDQSVCFNINKENGFTFDATDSQVKPYINDETKGIPYCNKEMDTAVPCCLSSSEAY